MKRERITKREIEAVKRVYHNGDIPARILADEIGVSENAFYRWLSGSRTPGYLVTARIRQFLKKHTFSEHAGMKIETSLVDGEIDDREDREIGRGLQVARNALAKTEAKVAEYRKRGQR